MVFSAGVERKIHTEQGKEHQRTNSELRIFAHVRRIDYILEFLVCARQALVSRKRTAVTRRSLISFWSCRF